MFDRIHTEPVTTIDQRRSSLRLLDKMAEKVWLWEVEPFDATLGDDTAVVGLWYLSETNREVEGKANCLQP